MNSAELVNLILGKLRRVKLLVIQTRAARFVIGSNEYTAAVCFDGSIVVYRWVVIDNVEKNVIDNYQIWVEGLLNGLARNDDGELVECSK